MITETYVATAGQTVFPFTFPFLAAADLTVAVDGVETSSWDLTSAQTVTLNGDFTGGGALTEGQEVSVARTTPIDTPAVTFASPSTLRSSEINRAVQQLLFNLQEQDADTTAGMRKNLGGTAWDAESIPVKSLGAPVDSGDAARLADIENAIVAGGNIPAFSIADAGRSLAIDVNGNVGWASAGGGLSVFEVTTQDPPPVAYANGGSLLVTSTNGIQTPGSQLPLTKLADVMPWFSGTAPSVVGDAELLLPTAGVYEVTAHGNLRTIPEAGVDIQHGAKLGITDFLSGSVVLDQIQNITLGRSGDTDPWISSYGFTLRAYVTVTTPVSLSLRGVRIGSPTVLMDVPTRVEVREVR